MKTWKNFIEETERCIFVNRDKNACKICEDSLSLSFKFF